MYWCLLVVDRDGNTLSVLLDLAAEVLVLRHKLGVVEGQGGNLQTRKGANGQPKARDTWKGAALHPWCWVMVPVRCAGRWDIRLSIGVYLP